jgi:murein DD-endopeptidase MepM/ murein hydrolase activator NlpD
VSQTQKAEADRFVARRHANARGYRGRRRSAAARRVRCVGAGAPPYQVYTVVDGDTLSSIAERFGVSADYIAANNIELRNADQLTLGQLIIIPAGTASCTRSAGETLATSRRRHIEARSRVRLEWHADRARSWRRSRVRAERRSADVRAGPEPAPEAGGGDGVRRATAAFGQHRPQLRRGPDLRWPGRSRYYSAGHPLGIDIDALASAGAAVGA